MADGLQVVSARLLVADVRVDACIAGSAGQVLAISEGDVLAVATLVALGESEINNVNGVFIGFVPANQKVVGFDVAVNNSFFVDDLNALDHLGCDVQH